MLRDNKKIKISFITAGLPNKSASARFRAYQFLPYFQAADVVEIIGVVTINQKISRALLLSSFLKLVYFACKSNLVFIQKVRFPQAFFRVLTILTKVVYDFDDSNFLPPPSWDPSKDFTSRRKRVDFTLKYSHQIIAGNEYLANYASKFNKNVEIIPTVVTTHPDLPSASYRWGVPAQVYVPIGKRDNDAIVVGWIGGGEHVIQLNQVLPALIQLQEQYKICVKVVSNRKWQPEGLIVHNKNWELGEEVSDVQSFDIGLMPLDASDPFLKGKCAFKAIEYMSVGIPVVATLVGANKKVIVDGKTGYLVKSSKEWYQYLKILIEDPVLRGKLGNNARNWAEEEYSLNNILPKLTEVFKRLVPKS